MEQSEFEWRLFQFRMKWDRSSQAELHKDLLILHLIVAPIIEKYKSEDDIQFWRCHRRADPYDEAGHEFALYVYTRLDTAKKIKKDIEDNDIYMELLKKGHFEKKLNFIENGGKSPEDLSGNWHPLIRKTWPHFIQGSTEMLIALISEIKDYLRAKGELKEGNLEELISDYKKVDDLIAKLWMKDFQDAFAHNLYAIFGYKPCLFCGVIVHKM